MSIFLFSILGFVALALVVAVLVALNSLRTKGTIARSLSMTLLSVTLPRPLAGAGGTAKPEKDLVAVMEQLYSSFSDLHAGGWNKFIYGEPYLAFEIAVKNVGQDIHFFASVPRTYRAVFEKQVHGFFPDAEIEPVSDYNIFHPHGAATAAYLTLKENPILPLKTYLNMPSDPLGEILTSLSKIEHQGEGAAIQILIRPSHHEHHRKFAHTVVQEMQRGHQLKDALSRAHKPPKEQAPDPASPQPPKVVTAFEEEIMKAVQAKGSKPLFDVCTRLVVSADDQTRAQQILNELAGSFVQFSTPQMNSFNITLAKGAALKNLLFNFSFRLFDRGQSMLLSSEELASIYHFPVAASAPRVKFLKSKPAQPPLNLPQQGISVGANIFRGAETAIRLDRSDRRRHLYLLGQTGTGKTTLMKNMMVQDIAAGDGVCFIDPHGTGVEEILELIPPERAADVIVFDPADIQYPLGLNMLEFDPRFPEQKTFIVNELLSIFQKLFLAETMGPMFDQYFRNAVLLLLDDAAHEMPTLVNIPRVLTDEKYRREKLTRETNPIVKHFWEQEAEKAGGEAALANMAPYITSKINGFIANEYLRPILSQPHSSLNFREIMDQRKILLVNLSKGRIGDINANLLGMLIVGKLLMTALSRVDAPEDSRPDFYLYIDEFQNFTTDSIATILAEARKYRLNLVIAHQYVKQLADKIRDAVFGNIGSMIVFRVGADDAEYLKNHFDPIFTPQDLMNIDNFNAYAKLLIHNQTASPFNIRINQPPTGDPQMAEHLKDLSRQRYGRAS
ncbi:MAG TPA: hypothetical protein VG941_02515 [Candidatus Paceibacterota bacterium]|nr:hypothetical protein [Candidatus Paceibacterota bacterium]